MEFVLENSRSGCFEPSAEEAFSESKWGENTNAYLESIEGISEKRWKNIIEGALGHANLRTAGPEGRDSESIPTNKRRMLIDLSEVSD